VDQIRGDSLMAQGVRMFQMQSLRCGYVHCGHRGAEGLTACSACRIQRYCSKEHQKKDWRHHKLICNKGLVEQEVSE